MNTNEQRVLITGSSSGIGFELAREFARHGHPLVLVATDEAKLGEARDAIRGESNVSVEIFAADLREKEQIAALVDKLQHNRLEIEILCNNAGIGFRGKFWEVNEDELVSMVQLNIEAVVRLTRALLPGMVTRGHGRVLNTASVAGFQPAPTMATYHATKSFVLSLSEALATELDGTGVTLTALCPGPVDTEFFQRGDLVESMAFQKANVMAPQEVAATAYKSLMACERDIIPGGLNKAMVFSRRFLSESAQAKVNQKMYEDVAPKDHQREPGEITAIAERKRRK